MQVLTVEDGAEDLTKVEGIDTNGISRCLEVRFKRDEIYVCSLLSLLFFF